MKVYTKTGDQGFTSLIGGTRVPKYHPRIEAYGTVDELNSYIGLIRDKCDDNRSQDTLLKIQKSLFVLESRLALEPDETKHTYKCNHLPTIKVEDINFLETEIDFMSDALPELRHFILPGGHELVSYCHISRTICRRAERTVLFLALDNPVEEVLIKYLNRLSDYLFVLARYFGQLMQIDEIKWETK